MGCTTLHKKHMIRDNRCKSLKRTVVVGRKFANEMMEKLEFVAIQRDKVLK
jgi:hypothetical protein